jgi:hypothetical protein
MHHHLVQLIQRQSKTQQKMLWGLLAAVLAGGARSGELGNVMVGAQLYMIAKLNGYGREAERDADKTGLLYLRHTRFNPTGMLTVMKRFARDETRRGNPELGIYQSHPYSRERADLITGYLQAAGVKFDLSTERAVSNAFQMETRPATAAGKPAAELLLNGDVLFRATAAEGQAPLDRARAIQKRLQQLLDQNLTLRALSLSPDKSQILAGGKPLLTVYPSDAEANGASLPETSQRALNVLQKALWKEQIDQAY